MCTWILSQRLFVQFREIHSDRIIRIVVTVIVSINTFRYSYVRARCSVSIVNFAFRDLQESFGFYTLQVPRNTNKWVSSFRSVPRLKRTIGENLFRHDPAGDQKRNHGINNLLRKSHHLTSSSFRVRKLPSSTFSPTNEIETHNSCFRKVSNNPNESNPKIIHHEQAIQGRTSAW